MELAKIESLLEAYFEGNTTLQEEALLRSYFKGTVAPHLLPYQPLFAGLAAAKQEVSPRALVLPGTSSKHKKWWYGVAASAVIAIGVAGFVFSEPQMTTEEKEALLALNKSKEVMLLLSENLNKGAGDLVLIEQFTKTKNKILK